jgi:type IV secretion system protein VirB10
MNQMPPLVMPAPPEPIVPVNELPPTVATTPIPLQSSPVIAKPTVIEDPDWVTRKINASVLIDTKGREGSAQPTEVQANKSKDAKDTKEVKTSDENGIITQGELSRNLKPLVEAKGVSASILPNRNFMIAKGTLLDCALETAIDSSLAGLITCRLTRDVYSDNGRVIMLDRGSQLVGEYKSGMAEGIVRIFVLWTRAKTPKGVVINLDSPGTDALGRSGLEGFVDTHFMERFGTAIMMSLVQESFDYARAQQVGINANNSTVSTSPGRSNSILDRLATEQMRKSMTIPPVLYINQGANVQVMVVRDLDFSTVYGIEEKELDYLFVGEL